MKKTHTILCPDMSPFHMQFLVDAFNSEGYNIVYLDTTTDNLEYNSTECFEIFGIKLHFDDLLIIALLFFLYQEDVKDTYLYIALILLLLS